MERRQTSREDKGIVILTTRSSGSRPRLSTSALLSLLASAARSHPRRRMQAAVRSVNHPVLWVAPLRQVLPSACLCCEENDAVN